MFRLTENDVREMIKEAVIRVLETRIEISDKYVTRIPYPIELAFTDHAIEREFQRHITKESIKEDVRAAIPALIEDYLGGILKDGNVFKVINRESCNVSVCAIFINGKSVKKISVITSYVWDGRINIDKGYTYYVKEESPAYMEAKQWNAEHQDIVMDYMDWKRNAPIMNQRRRAEREYNYRLNSTLSPSKRMELVNLTYDNQERFNRKAIHNSIHPEDFKAIQDYYKKVDSMPLSSKGSMNRDLRAMDLMKMRKQQQRDENNQNQ